MTLFELLDARMEQIKQVGERAIEGARRDGVPAVYMDASLGPGMIRELPDGTREQIELVNGQIVVVGRYDRRA